MVRDVAYDGLSFKRRKEIHLRAAAAMEKEAAHPEDAADQLAMHYSIGGDAERTWHYSLLAADRAARSSANIEAALQYQRALEAVRRLPGVSAATRAAVWVRLGDSRKQASLFEGALDAYKRGSNEVGDDSIAVAEIFLKRASAREYVGSYSSALSETTRAKNLLAANDLPVARAVAARAGAFAALIRQRQERPVDALREALLAQEAALSAGDTIALAGAYNVTSWAYLMLDKPGATELFAKALGLYEELGDLVGQADVTNNMGGLAYFEGRWTEALEYYERSRASYDRLGDVGLAGFAEMNIGEVLVNQRRLDLAEGVLRRASRVLRSIGFIQGATFAEMQLGRVAMERGELDTAERLLRAINVEVTELGYASGAFESALYLAEALIAAGDEDEALLLLDGVVAKNADESSIYLPTAARIRASALFALGREGEAATEIRLGLDVARKRGLDYEVALLLVLQDRVSKSSDSAEALLEASKTLNRLGVRQSVDAPH
jgi:tetratricopeptide (TPR) repeat protein